MNVFGELYFLLEYRDEEVALGDRQIATGPSYFFKKNLSPEWIDLIWEHAFIPYLTERLRSLPPPDPPPSLPPPSDDPPICKSPDMPTFDLTDCLPAGRRGNTKASL